MLILVLILCLATSLYVALRRKDSLSLYLLGMSVCNLVMFAGIIVYIAAIGGTAAQQREFLFLVPKLQVWLHALPIPMDRLGYVVAVGRSLFPLFALQAALEATMIPALRRRMKSRACRHVWYRHCPSFIIIPAVFRTVVSGRFWLRRCPFTFRWPGCILYLVAAGLLFFQEYHATTMPVFKLQHPLCAALLRQYLHPLPALRQQGPGTDLQHVHLRVYPPGHQQLHQRGAARPGVDHPGSVHGVLCGAGQLQSGALYPAYL